MFKRLKEGLKALLYTYFPNNNKFGRLGKNSIVHKPFRGVKENVYIGNHTSISPRATFVTHAGMLVIKDHCSISGNFTAITFNHPYERCEHRVNDEHWGKCSGEKTVIENEVWIGINVTLLPGVIVQRGMIIGANSLLTQKDSFPPYSIVAGNPARFIKFKYSLEEQIEHERLFYESCERIPIETLTANWEKYTSKK